MSQYSSYDTSTITAIINFVTTASIDGGPVLNCPLCDHTFTSRIGLVGHFRIHRTETGEPVSGAPTHSRDHSIHCLTALTHSLIAWAYSVTCATMTVELTAMSTAPILHAHPQFLPFSPPLAPQLPRP
ncbi:unnamed protein product [Schistocephalus solidus]|uniref:C2H2-type domain-containing protein n=1 Tax=Schistocephalus solidus TaxID=70667 RepID=A0A183SDN1_SCHSO|nr:unnamed protein product [Schistocephalus solidus]